MQIECIMYVIIVTDNCDWSELWWPMVSDERYSEQLCAAHLNATAEAQAERSGEESTIK